jgi:DNA-binding transcriptional ArsR family regulator
MSKGGTSGDTSAVTKAVKNGYERVRLGTRDGNGSAPRHAENRKAHEIPKEDAFEILKNRRRRDILHYLKQNGSEAEVGEMAKQIAAWENDTDVDAVTSKQRKRLYTALYQSHLPKMDDVGILEYNQRRGYVELTDEGSELDVYLEFVPGNDINWSQYYLALTCVSAVLFAAQYFGVYPFALSTSTVTAVVVTAFGVSAFVHMYKNAMNKIGRQGPPPTAERRTNARKDRGDSER